MTLTKRQKYLSYLLGTVCLYTLLADYSIYYIKYTNVASQVFAFFVILILNIKGGIIESRSRANAFFFLSGWFVLFFVSFFINDFPIPIGFVAMILFGSLYIILNENIRRMSLNVFASLYAILLAISFLEYVLTFVGISVNLGTIYRDGNEYAPYTHYVFNIIKELTPRFQGLTEEAGVVGTLNGFLFYVLDEKKFRYQKFVYLITGIFSFSFAFYIIVIFTLFTKKTAIIKWVFIIVLGWGFYIVAPELVEYFVFERVTERGIDNRTRDDLQYEYDRAQHNNDLWLGLGYKSEQKYLKNEMGSAGIKVFIFNFGYFGLFVIFTIYCFIFFRNVKPNKFNVLFFILFWVSFYQRQFIHNFFYTLILFSFYIEADNNKINKTILSKFK